MRSQRSHSTSALKRASRRSVFDLEQTTFFCNACHEELYTKNKRKLAKKSWAESKHNGEGRVTGHNRGILKASEHSIIGKTLSMLCTDQSVARRPGC